MDSLLSSFRDYFKSVTLVMQLLQSSETSLPELLRPIHNLSEQLGLCSRAQLSDAFVHTFPNAKERLLGKIRACLEEEFAAFVSVQESIKAYVDKLKVQLNSIEKAYEMLDETQEVEFNPLVPSHEELFELAVDSWRIIHVLWLEIKTAIETIDFLDTGSIKQVSKAFSKHNKTQAHFEYVSELTRYLRSS